MKNSIIISAFSIALAASSMIVGLNNALAQPIRVSPTTLNWPGEPYPGTSTPATFIITNISSDVVTGTFQNVTAPFSIDQSTFSIAPMETDTVTATFAPTDNGGGLYRDTVTIASSDGTPYTTIAFYAVGRNINESNIFVSTDHLDFGNVAVGTTDTLLVVISNLHPTSTAIVNVHQFNHSLAFTFVKGSGPKNINEVPDSILVAFTPAEAIQYSDTLVFTSNDTSQPIIKIPVYGAGVVSGVAAQMSMPALSIYPTIASTELHVVSSDPMQSVEIVNMVGRTLLSSPQADVNVHSLPNGNYFCVVKTEKGTAVVWFIVNR
ncbi:MAG TPA: T9SS type A sorting domain-containing protein [Candidatus Kapabacteria bacterium]|jgi:hypothetical protein|nr:T9SS type A sorting domain-containing protein [Candidatus Kapabacteria bacterium]